MHISSASLKLLRCFAMLLLTPCCLLCEARPALARLGPQSNICGASWESPPCRPYTVRAILCAALPRTHSLHAVRGAGHDQHRRVQVHVQVDARAARHLPLLDPALKAPDGVHHAHHGLLAARRSEASKVREELEGQEGGGEHDGREWIGGEERWRGGTKIMNLGDGGGRGGGGGGGWRG